MAEFQEVCKQWRRMCAHGSEDYACADCKMYSSVDQSVCRGIPDKDKTKIIEGFVMQWAAEHPEPVYPTFGEWLEKQGIVKLVNGNRYEEDGRKVYMLLESVENQIPADIAEKLGIEPKGES